MDCSGGRGVLIFIFCCHLVSFILFSGGFMLKRVVIPEHSKCSAPSPPHHHHANTSQFHHSCSPHPRPFKRVLWLLVDALRYDFVIYDDTLATPPVYRNKMPFIRDLLSSHPENARLFKFVADPPTTTMQRLKALTTGSLPTFIDIGSNFNSYAILEDSIPLQAKLNGRNITFIGDDTWLGLYPDMLAKVFDYPSLNVQDLDTVDNGVIEHLGPELSKGDAEIVIGHMLGVDHVGHTYGPSHWTMGKKLAQMNGFLEQVLSEMLDEDTVAFVFGDHGMSPTGDHGGETSLETDAALLVYSPRPLFNPAETPYGREVYQVDLVPTTALAVGLPIPFSNLGMLIPEVFLPYKESVAEVDAAQKRVSGEGFKGRVTLEFLDLLQMNAEQIHTYLLTYAEYSQDFPTSTFNLLKAKYENVLSQHTQLKKSFEGEDSQLNLTSIASGYFAYMRDVKGMCQRVWAKFDDLPMTKGLILLFVVVVATPIMFLDVSMSSLFLSLSQPGLKMSLTLAVLSLLVANTIDISPYGILVLLLNFAFVSLTAILLTVLWKFRWIAVETVSRLKWPSALFEVNFIQVLAVSLLVLHAVSMLSNSFILYEADMLAFFVQSLVVCFALRTLSVEVSTQKHSHKKTAQLSLVKAVLPHFLLMCCVRLSKLFYACRDLQIQDGCEPTSFIMPLASAAEHISLFSYLRFLMSVVCILSMPASILIALRRSGCGHYLNPKLVVACRIGFPLSVVGVAVHWIIQSLPHDTFLFVPHWLHVTPPWVVYISCTAVVTLCLANPFRSDLHSLVSSEDAKEGKADPKTDKSDPPLHLGEKAESASSTSIDTRQRKGLHDLNVETVGITGVSSGIQPSTLIVGVSGLLLTALWLPIAMLLNDGIALSATLTAAEIFLTVKLLQKSEKGVSLESCVLWLFLGCHSFFAFGHHATVTSLRFEAAFAGIHGEITAYNLPLAAILVGANTMASQILFGLGFPLLLGVGGGDNGRNSTPTQNLVPCMILYSGFNSVKLLVTMFAASLHRRHLMVWWVFAPRFLYEGAFQAAADIGMLLALALVRRLENKLVRQ